LYLATRPPRSHLFPYTTLFRSQNLWFGALQKLRFLRKNLRQRSIQYAHERLISFYRVALQYVFHLHLIWLRLIFYLKYRILYSLFYFFIPTDYLYFLILLHRSNLFIENQPFVEYELR